LVLDTPNPAFEGSTPLQVIERGESDRLWRMIWEASDGEFGGLKTNASKNSYGQIDTWLRLEASSGWLQTKARFWCIPIKLASADRRSIQGRALRQKIAKLLDELQKFKDRPVDRIESMGGSPRSPNSAGAFYRLRRSITNRLDQFL
jgi:hypothetical protein